MAAVHNPHTNNQGTTPQHKTSHCCHSEPPVAASEEVAKCSPGGPGGVPRNETAIPVCCPSERGSCDPQTPFVLPVPGHTLRPLQQHHHHLAPRQLHIIYSSIRGHSSVCVQVFSLLFFSSNGVVSHLKGHVFFVSKVAS
eukprot:TRINITY_DN66571_c12_g3_i3.p2 TRINITY_DN66571_c12_g3~~TRINITY_DN66571_c12_g3_i3.p2  ORF type:complete len:140 (-),score=2.23 TRINITY_DN66571_c12_g3_i3:341-760(-)